MQQELNQHSSLNQWLDYLFTLHPTEIDLGLQRIKSVAAELGLLDLVNNHHKPLVITVAGTNGKGSTCAILESILIKAGHKVGVYSSPHIMHFNERVRLNGKDVADNLFIQAFAQIERARKNHPLTFFEYTTLAGLLIFKAANLDVVILEVGLGGRLDATNIIDADVAVITAIDIDHQDYLGDNREQIGFEKAGIFKTEAKAIVGDPDVPDSVVQHAKSLAIAPYLVNHDLGFKFQVTENNWQFSGQKWQLNQLPIPALPLANAAIALAVLEQISDRLWPNIPNNLVQNWLEKGLETAKLAGRFEQIANQPDIYLDVAHNPHAASYLAQKLRQIKNENPNKKIIGFCAMLKDKDIAGVGKQLFDIVDVWYLAGLQEERGANIDTLSTDLFSQCSEKLNNVQYFENIQSAWCALNAHLTEQDVVIGFGSFYTVSAIKSLMGGN